MATLVLDCPYCSVKKMGFTYQNEFHFAGHHNGIAVGATCNGCQMPILAVLSANSIATNSGRTPKTFDGDLLMSNGYFATISILPTPPENDAPESSPDAVKRAFHQGSSSRNIGNYDAACGMYRKTMELALKAFSPDIEAWKIEKRIDKMAAENRITPELQTWAHELRLDGNDAMHGDEEATREMADQMHDFCKFLLIYLYTLPAQVKVAKQRRAEEK